MSLKQTPLPVTQDAARATARLSRQLAVALGDVDLSPSQYRLLLFLSEGNAAASAVAWRLAVSRPSVTALADGLEKRGLLQRKSVPSDRRRVAHQLTEAGREVLFAAELAMGNHLDRIARHLDPDEAQQALAGLAYWNEAINRFRTNRTEDETQSSLPAEETS